LVGLGEEHFFYGEPVVYAAVAGDVDVGGGGVEDAFSKGPTVPAIFSPTILAILKQAELAGVVVDEIVGAEDALVAAEDDVGGGDEGEVFGKPVVLGGEAGGDFHGGGGDEDFIAGLEAFEDALGVGHDAEDAEEVFFAKVVVDEGMAFGGGDLPEAAAAEIVEGEAIGEVAVVAGEVFSEGVGDNFVHVYGDDLTFGGVRGRHVAVGLRKTVSSG
jgi:hypothetical protein